MKIASFVHSSPTVQEQPFEVVEIKGRGHPDTICDLLCEQISDDLLAYYSKECGRPLHYNIDKAFLSGGRSAPKFGGGKILEPAKLFLGDRATYDFGDRRLPLQEIVKTSISGWLSKNLRFLRLDNELELINQIKPGSSSLSAVEENNLSNDTSVGVGSWPRSPLESAVFQLEAYLNSKEFKQMHPETGEDIKVMAVRDGRQIRIICAIAMVDRFIGSMDEYKSKKQTVTQAITKYLQSLKIDAEFSVQVNALDSFDRGEGGLHLTVSGLSCESGDSGQVGRGNRVNGLISFMRPQTMEAWAGKNPVTHVGKIYSFAAQKLAKCLCDEFQEIAQADVFLVGQIGSPVNTPGHVYCTLVTRNASGAKSLIDAANEFLRKELEKTTVFHPRSLRNLS